MSPIKEKQGRAMDFMGSIRSCLSAEVILISMMRKFSRQAHQHILAYHAMPLTLANSIKHYSSSVISMFQWQSKIL
jgi:hypothetical protein